MSRYREPDRLFLEGFPEPYSVQGDVRRLATSQRRAKHLRIPTPKKFTRFVTVVFISILANSELLNWSLSNYLLRSWIGCEVGHVMIFV
jgi:hypothetical protein